MEYCRGVMDAFSDPKVRRVVMMSSAQVAKTTIIENVIGYFIHHDPCPIMVVQPTLEIAESFSKDRLAAMIRDTPVLKQRVAPEGSKSSGNTLLHKKFPGGHLTIAGANSYNSLASRPERIVLGDEGAKWKYNEQGSPFRQVSARVKGFYWTSKQGYFSTPTGLNNEFQDIWEASDKRIFEVPCPHCQAAIVLTFDDERSSLPTDTDVSRAILRWEEGPTTRNDEGREIRRAADAWFECLACGGRIDEVDRHRAVQQGRWRATQPFYDTAGFWIWQGYSPLSTARMIANEWLSALGDIKQLQSVKNETLGLPWREQGSAPEWRRLYDRAQTETYCLGTVPPGVLALTAGVDVQQDRLEIQVVGWGRRGQCWLVDYIVLDGDTGRAAVWESLTKILGIVYRSERGAEFTILRMAVDSGFQAQTVYEWARKHLYGRVAVIKGGPDTQSALVAAPSSVDISRNGKKIPSGVKIRLLNTSEFKKDLYARLSLDGPNLERGEEYPDRYFHICPLPDTEEYCRQLTAEELVTSYHNGFPKRGWEKPPGRRNEALDTWVYARAAAVIEGINRYSEQHWSALEQQAGITREPIAVPVAHNTPTPATAPVQRDAGQTAVSSGFMRSFLG